MSTSIFLDSGDGLSLILPKRDEELIALAEAYLAHESAQPVAAQLSLPVLTEVHATYMAARDAMLSALDGESDRTYGTETYGQLMQSIKSKLKWAIQSRVRTFPDTPSLIEAWGVQTVIGASGRLLRFPTRQAGWHLLLERYIAKEESLPPEQQWADPPLTDFETLREQLLTSDTTRKTGFNKRKLNTHSRREITRQLKRHLQMALHVLVYTRYDGELHLDLIDWGFPVQYQRPAADTTPETPPAEPAAAPVSAMSAPVPMSVPAPIAVPTNGSSH